MSNEIKVSKKEFFNFFKDKNTVYYVEYSNKNGMIFFEKVKGCNESPERSKDTMTINQLANIVKEGFNQVNNRLDKVEQRLDTLEKDVVDLKTEMKEVKSDISILKKEMKEVKSDIALIKKCPTIQREMNNF